MPNLGPRRGNRSAAEDFFEDACREAGVKAVRGGWPDYAVIDREGKLLALVEVKLGNDIAHPHQRAMHDVLRGAGIKVVVLYPEEFPKFKKQIRIEALRHRGIPPEVPVSSLGEGV